jgi:glycosyltransferase involved in cell wall biosynthesis
MESNEMTESFQVLLKVRYAIFLPVKNGAKYIAAAIQSILTQRESNFLLVILENKSSDSTLSIIQQFHDKRIAIVEANEDLGIYENWNRVHELLLSREIVAEFCTIIGYDDIFYPEFLETINNLIAENPGASLYQTQFNVIDNKGSTLRPCKPIPSRETCRDFFLARCWRLRDSFGTGYVFRVSDYLRVGGIPNLPMLLWSDDLLVMRLTRLSWKASASIICFAYRQHSASVSALQTRGKIRAVVLASEQFVKCVETEFSELITDDFGRISLGLMIDTQIMPFKHAFSNRMFDVTVNEKLDRMAALKSDLLERAQFTSRSFVGYRLFGLGKMLYYFLMWFRSK